MSSQRSGDWVGGQRVGHEVALCALPSAAQNLSATGLSHYKPILLINFTPRKFRIGKAGGNRNYVEADDGVVVWYTTDPPRGCGYSWLFFLLHVCIVGFPSRVSVIVKNGNPAIDGDETSMDMLFM